MTPIALAHERTPHLVRIEADRVRFCVCDRRWPVTTLTATEARKLLYRLLDDVANSHEPVQMAGKRGSAVLIAEDDWRAVQETLYLHSIKGMKESIIEGLGTPVEECEEELDW